MFETRIYTKQGDERCVITSIEYTGEWMAECYVLFDVTSPYPIEFEMGDWLEYRGERFELHYKPEVTMTAMPGTVQEAYRYEKVKFVSLAEELVNCDFLDYVLGENNLHFSGLPTFSFYASTVKDLADRIQANMNRFSEQNDLPYWTVEVAEECSGEENINISVTNISCFDALALSQSEFGVNFIIRGRKITIGAEGVPAAHLFRMGKDAAGNLNGLYEFQQQADSDQKIVTRLRAYGSERNMPRRYYNSLTDADGVKLVPDNMAVNRLMLPSFPYMTLDPYIDSINIRELGVIEDTVTFDGSDGLEEIYPSIETATADELKASGYPTKSSGRLDEIVSAEQIQDDGEGTEKGDEIVPDSDTFTVTIKDVGFDIMDYLSDETPTLSFKNGMLGGRDFEILTGEHKPKQNPDGTWLLTLNRVYDESLGLFFPYRYYNAHPGDRFVLTGIFMPEIYIKMSSYRLLLAAQEYISKNDYARSVFNPKVDEIFMAQQHQKFLRGEATESLYLTLKEGGLLTFEEESLRVAASSIFIDKLTIKEGDGKPIPTYEITLREEKVVGTLQRIQNQIDSIKNGSSGSGGGGYNTEQLKQLIKAIGSSLFLSKITNDATPYNITVGGIMNAVMGVLTGAYRQGESGAYISRAGSAEFEDVFSRKQSWFLGGLMIGDYIKNELGAYLSADGFAELRELLVRESAVFKGKLSSEKFISGFLDGIGWALTEHEGKYKFEIDELVVRGTMKVFELMISQLVGENDNRVFTSSLKVDHYDSETGIIWLDTQGGTFYNPFRKDDYIRVQQFNGTPLSNGDGNYLTKQYEFVVTESGIGSLTDGENRLDWVKFRDFTTPIETAMAENLIAKGDTLTRIDNDSDKSRKGIIQIISVGDDTPYIDVNYGLKTDPLNSLKARLGNLQGIRHELFGWLQGWGLFSENAYLVGDFRVARTGDSLDTLFQILHDRFSSQYSQITYDITEEENYLANPTFTEGMKDWEVKLDTASIVYCDELTMLINGNVFISDGEDAHRATVSEYEGRRMLYLLNSGVWQKNSVIRQKMERFGLELQHDVYNTDFSTDDSTEGINDSKTKEDNTLYLTIKLRVISGGRLTIGFNKGQGTLPHTTESIELEASKDWKIIEWEGTWDGEGDFVLEFTGEMYVNTLSLTNDPLNDYKKETGTRIEQTAKNIKLLGWNIDSANDSIAQLGIVLDAAEKKLELYVEETTSNTQKISQLEITAEGIEQRVSDTESGIAVLLVTATDITARVENVAGDVTQLQITAEGLRSEVTDAQGNISAIEQSVGAIGLSVTNLADSYAGLELKVTELESDLSLVVKKNDVIASINLSAEEQGGSLIKIHADKISLEGYTTINQYFVVNADGSVEIQKEARIAGLKIDGDGLTNEGFNNNAFIVLRNDNNKEFVGIGTNVFSTETLVSGVGRFENHNERRLASYGFYTNYAIRVSAQGARQNIAIDMDGGCVAGMAMQTRVVSSSITLDKRDYQIVCINTSDITITLPSMKVYDDGHVIRIKRQGGGRVYIKMQDCEYISNTDYSVQTNRPVISYYTSAAPDRASYITGDNTFLLNRVHDSMELVWVRDVTTEVNGTSYHGMWLQYILPRE